MRISIPGVPGLYYDTDSENTAATVAFTAASRRAPKPQGYALQLLPYLWSFEVDLRDLPPDHPIQYLHPEGARSLGTLASDPTARAVGTDLEAVLRFVWEVNRATESGVRSAFGGGDREGVVIEIEDGRVGVDGEELGTDAFDVEEPTDPELDEFEAQSEDRDEFGFDEDSPDRFGSGDEGGDDGERTRDGDDEPEF